MISHFSSCFYYYYYYYYLHEDGRVYMCKSESLVLVKLYFSNETVQSFKTPAVHVRCDLTTQSTMFSRVGISALLSWNFTGKVLSKFIVCLTSSYLTLRPTQQIW